jgi:hypothetical protein
METSLLTISIVTKMQLIVGCRNKNELQKLESFLSKNILIFLDKIRAIKVSFTSFVFL